MDLTHFGKYEVTGLIGSGGFADVYRCRDHALEIDVAVKVMHPHLARQDDVRERFIREARILHQLHRAGYERVVGVVYVDELEDGRPFFVMPYLHRGSMADLIREFDEPDSLDLPKLVGLSRELVECLEVLRDREVVHRDLKPDNILILDLPVGRHNPRRHDRYGLPADERLVLADFGLSKILESSSSSLSQIAGTPWYVAPEQVSIDGSIDWRADQFAVGVMMYELAAGFVPWPERNWESVRDVRPELAELGELRPDLPLQFESIVQRAIQPDPMDRYATPAEIIRELEELIDADTRERSGELDSVEQSVIHLISTTERLLPAEAGQDLVRSARDRLEQPVSVAMVAADRAAEPAFAVRVAGDILDPDHSSLVGSALIRIGAAPEPLFRGRLTSGEIVEGEIEGAYEGPVRLRLRAPVYAVAELRLGLPNWALADLQLVDIPQAVLDRGGERVTDCLRGADLVFVGLHGSRQRQARLIDTVLRVIGRAPGDGPIAMFGIGSVANPESAGRVAGVRAVLVREDVSRVRDAIDGIAGEHGPELRVSRVLEMLDGGTRPIDLDGQVGRAVEVVLDAFPRIGRWLAMRDAATGRLSLPAHLVDELSGLVFTEAVEEVALVEPVVPDPTRAAELRRLRNTLPGRLDQRALDALLTLHGGRG